MGSVASTPSMSNTTSKIGNKKPSHSSPNKPNITPKVVKETSTSPPSKPTTLTERVLVRQADESEDAYKERSQLFSEIIAGLGLTKPDDVSLDDFHSFGRSTYGIEEYSIPSPKWNTIQCIYWVRQYLFCKVWMSEKDATAMACKFKETGACLVRMEKEDWKNMFKEDRNGWMSLWARIEELKEDGLIGAEDAMKEAVPEEERDDLWADELLDFTTEEVTT